MLIFKGLQKTTLIDFPGEIACTLFLPKCNFRCPYCYNPKLVFEKDTGQSIPENEIFDFLDGRKGLLDGVCITGGEPALHTELPKFCRKVKEKGFLVKVDTNGSNPEMLKRLIDEKLVDYIAMDIKAPLEKYEEVTGVAVDKEAIKKSVELIKKSGVKYEFRTTILPKFISENDLLEIGKWLKGAKFFALQQFSPAPEMIDKSLGNEKRYTKEELKGFGKLLEGFFEKVEVRNV
ncbi:MAG: anaerobic ribonucleoside-triphosphate reductase activating protein [archaeon]|jgi:pyruvate formate lyase activating enzyme|nr:anaerobic ribonucleoside-triphosphate reductase activating protein [archaeon]